MQLGTWESVEVEFHKRNGMKWLGDFSADISIVSIQFSEVIKTFHKES